MITPETQPSYRTYEAALTESGQGYEDKELTRVLLYKTKLIIQHGVPKTTHPLLAEAILLSINLAASNRSKPIRVLDFGGGFAIHFFFVLQSMGFVGKWAVVETQPVVDAAAELARENLKFFSNIETAVTWLEGVDLVLASGSIEYTPAPENYLAHLLTIKSPYAAILRCSLSYGERKIIVQARLLSQMLIKEIPPDVQDRLVSYPGTFMAASDFHHAITSAHRIHGHSYDYRERPFLVDGTLLKHGDNFLLARK